MKPKESAECHQTLSSRVGSGHKTTAVTLSVSSLCTPYIVLVWLIMSYQHSEPEHFQLLAEVRIRMCSLEPRFSVPDFVSQLWRKIGGFSKAARQNPEQKAWVRG